MLMDEGREMPRRLTGQPRTVWLDDFCPISSQETDIHKGGQAKWGMATLTLGLERATGGKEDVEETQKVSARCRLEGLHRCDLRFSAEPMGRI